MRTMINVYRLNISLKMYNGVIFFQESNNISLDTFYRKMKMVEIRLASEKEKQVSNLRWGFTFGLV